MVGWAAVDGRLVTVCAVTTPCVSPPVFIGRFNALRFAAYKSSPVPPGELPAPAYS